jgi:hypothetical protein
MIFGPNLVMEAEEIVNCIQSNLKATKARQESDASCLSLKRAITCIFMSCPCVV